MDEVLQSLTNNQDTERTSATVQLLKVYVNNVVKNPSNAKFRKIRISNSKFYSVIWNNEDARSFLLLAGFEESGDFLVLPDGVCLDAAKSLLDNVATTGDTPAISEKIKLLQTAAEKPPSHNLLKLRSLSDNSVFDEVVKADMTLLSYMKEMGFDVDVAEKALVVTKNQGVQPAMDWVNGNPVKVDEIRMARFKKAAGNTEKAMESEHLLPTTEGAPVSRYQSTIDERHKFQERLRLEAIEAARAEKAEQKRQKAYLLKNLEDEKKERREKGERVKCMRMSDHEGATSETNGAPTKQTALVDQEDNISLRLRLPDGQVTLLKVQSDSPLRSIYRHISQVSELKEEEFTVMTTLPQRKLIEKEKRLEELGIKTQETLVVQRLDQAGSLMKGHGEIRQVLEIETEEQWERILSENSNKLIVVEIFATRSADCKRSVREYEAVNADYGIDKQVLFLRVNNDLLQASKNEYDIDVLPSYQLIWNKEVVCKINGLDQEKLEKAIKENLRGSSAEKVADKTSEDYFDPR